MIGRLFGLGLGFALALGLGGCAPRVHPEAPLIDVDDPAAGAPAEPAPAPAWDELPPAPPGPGARDVAVERGRVDAVLDAGPGAFLRGFEVVAVLDPGQVFRGWRLVQTMPGEHRFDGLDVVPGDVLVAVNGRPLSKPDDLQALWESLRAAPEIVFDVERDGTRFQIRLAVEDAAPPATPGR